MQVKFKKLRPGAECPEYAKPGDSGADLRYCPFTPSDNFIWPGETRILFTGVALELPDGYEAQVRPRSSLSSRGMLVHFGTCDSGYRGEIGVTMTNTTREPYKLQERDKIAQLVIVPVERAAFEQVEELGESARGASGWGSTGRQ